MDELPRAALRFQEAARKLGLEASIRSFPQSTRTADEAAAAIGVRVGQIVKSLVFMAGDKPVIALVSGANRLDTARLEYLVGGRVTRADADQVRSATGYSIGGVPPFGFGSALQTYIDRDLLQHDVVWAAAGTPKHVFPIRPDHLVKASGGAVQSLAVGTTTST